MDVEKKMPVVSSSNDEVITEMPPQGGEGRSTCLLPLLSHEQIINHPHSFKFALNRFHATFGSRAIAPVIGGKELDLYVFYAEVTKRGGFCKVVENKKWREISTIFQFAPTATSASYVLRKHYMALLYHFEQFYFFNQKAHYISQASAVSLYAKKAPTTPGTPVTCSAKSDNGASSSHHPTQTHQAQEKQLELVPIQNEGLKNSTVLGKIHGKIDHGYLVSVKVGSEILHGVLYHPAEESESSTPAPPSCTAIVPYVPLKVSHYKKKKHRDPDHPKSNRSAYNFFFAAKHSELKATIPVRERDFTKLIGEAWKSLTEEQRKVYHETGLKDKERYRREMNEYNERKAKALKGSDEGPSK